MKNAAVLEKINARTKIWAAGVRASPLASMLAEAPGAETDRAGRVMVLPDCTLPGHPEVFAIGDMVSLNKLPGVVQPAIQDGRYVGKVIRTRLDGDGNVPPFKYFDKGSMATIGYQAAVADAFGVQFTGSGNLSLCSTDREYRERRRCPRVVKHLGRSRMSMGPRTIRAPDPRITAQWVTRHAAVRSELT